MRPNYALIDERVTRGAAAFDIHEPDWFHRVDPFLLNMQNGQMCVVGQLYGSYEDRMASVAVAMDPSDHFGPYWDFAIAHGLQTPGPFSEEQGSYDYSDLDIAWIREINKRREAVAT